jgi:hypothetical protein
MTLLSCFLCALVLTSNVQGQVSEASKLVDQAVAKTFFRPQKDALSPVILGKIKLQLNLETENFTKITKSCRVKPLKFFITDSFQFLVT